MHPESKVVSLETAKRLKADGFPQETERWWVEDPHKTGNQETRELVSDWMAVNEKETYAAPDAQELGEALPRNLGSSLFIEFRENGWFMRLPGFETIHANLSEALAACYLYLKEK